VALIYKHGGCGGVLLPGKDWEISILHFSDTHITENPNFNMSVFLRAIEQINNLDVDYVIHTGDITEEGTREDYELAQKLLGKIKKKVIYIIGNHDARNVGYELFEGYIGSRRPLFMDDRVLIAGFDSTIPDRDRGRFGASSLQALKKILKDEGEDRVKIAAFHHHLLPVPRAGRERSMIEDAGDVSKAILDHNVNLVLNGHRHSPNIYKIEDSIIVNSGTVSHYKTRGGDYHSFNVIRISAESIFEVRVCNVENSTERRFTKAVKTGNKLVEADGRRIARIVHVSDTHISDSSDFSPKTYDLAVKRINQLSPDLVVHCGDVTHDGLPDSFELAVKMLSRISSPKLVVSGPHDFLHLGRMLFREKIGEFAPIYEGNMFSVYGANSSQFDEMDGLIGRSQLQRLVQNLAKTKSNSAKIVAFHHHILPPPNTREKYPIEDAGNVLKQLLNIEVDMILTGHCHIGHAQKIEETVVINANTLSSRRFQSRYGNTFNLIDVLSNGAVIVSEIMVLTGMRRILGIYKIPHSLDRERISTQVTSKKKI